jgi:hypothetical protein
MICLVLFGDLLFRLTLTGALDRLCYFIQAPWYVWIEVPGNSNNADACVI